MGVVAWSVSVRLICGLCNREKLQSPTVLLALFMQVTLVSENFMSCCGADVPLSPALMMLRRWPAIMQPPGTAVRCVEYSNGQISPYLTVRTWKDVCVASLCMSAMLYIFASSWGGTAKCQSR